MSDAQAESERPRKQIPRESWLTSDNHEMWADAAMLCQSIPGHCGADGFCHFGGDCFRDARSLDELDELLRRVRAVKMKLRILGYANEEIEAAMKERRRKQCGEPAT